MTHEELIFSLIGLAVTILLGAGGMFKWAMSTISSKVDDVVKRFDHNTDRVMDKFDKITDKMDDSFKKNDEVHEKIKLQVVELQGEIYHIQGQINSNGHHK